jgi:hypothetical protein
MYCAREYSLLLLKPAVAPFGAAGLSPQSPHSSWLPAACLLPLLKLPAPALPGLEPGLALLLLLLLPTLTCTAEGGGGLNGLPSTAALIFSR